MLWKNNELIERIFPGRFTESRKNRMSQEKEKKYQQEFRPYLKLINGLDEFLKLAYEKKIKMAIGSAAMMFNMDFVLEGLNIRKYFSALISADDVTHSKPDPETFIKCAGALVIVPADRLVFEDGPKGVEAAMNAKMKAVVITLMNEKKDFNAYHNLTYFIEDFSDKNLREQIV